MPLDKILAFTVSVTWWGGQTGAPFIVRQSNKTTLLHFVEQYVSQHSEQKPLRATTAVGLFKSKYNQG